MKKPDWDHPPAAYPTRAAYLADVVRIASIVAERDGDFYGIEEYARAVCRTKPGLRSIVAFSSSLSVNEGGAVDSNPRVRFAIEAFGEDVSDRVRAVLRA
jgi:hypothetical protein